MSELLIKERKKEEKRSVNVCDDGDFSITFEQGIFEVLSEINATLAKPIGGLPQLAHELQAKGHTSSVVADKWRECQTANKPVGAFLYPKGHNNFGPNMATCRLSPNRSGQSK